MIHTMFSGHVWMPANGVICRHIQYGGGGGGVVFISRDQEAVDVLNQRRYRNIP